MYFRNKVNRPNPKLQRSSRQSKHLSRYAFPNVDSRISHL